MDGLQGVPAAPPVEGMPRRAAPDRGAGRGPQGWLVVVVLLTVIGLAVAGFWVYALWVYSNHDRPELIDDPVVVQAVDSACIRMNEKVAASAVPPGASANVTAAAIRANVTAAAIRAQDTAVDEMVTSVRALEAKRLANDRPTEAWLSDWSTLVDAREQYAAALVAGRTPTWAVPVADGKPITRRMATVDAPCDVAALADLP